MMYEALRFVQGAVAKRDFIPAMQHFLIKDKMVRAFNGTIALCSPLDVDIVCAPRADMLVRAIANCTDILSVSMTTNMRLHINSGPFQIYVPCVDVEDVPIVAPTGEDIHIDGNILLKAFSTLERFIGTDAARPWSNGILLQGKSAFATNNVCLVEYWLGVDIPIPVNVPSAAVEEVLRIGKAPTGVLVDQNSISFLFEDGRWIRSQLLAVEWPTSVPNLLQVESTPVPMPPAIFDGLTALKPFLDTRSTRIHFADGRIWTSSAADDGASYAVDGLPDDCAFLLPMLMLLDGVATAVDFSKYPSPVPFRGDNLRGVILGVRL